jgi:hypothetical protein
MAPKTQLGNQPLPRLRPAGQREINSTPSPSHSLRLAKATTDKRGRGYKTDKTGGAREIDYPKEVLNLFVRSKKPILKIFHIIPAMGESRGHLVELHFTAM